MLDQAIRFGAILRRREYAGGGNLLEVGSGTEGIGAFTEEPIVGVDIRFETPPHFTAVKASVTALPFADGTFSRVICSDVLEHLPEVDRAGAIGELVRVTKGTLFLACPTGKGARMLDACLLGFYRLLPVDTPGWLREHNANRVPNPESIRRALRETGISFREIRGESCLTHLLVSFLISTRWLNRFWRSLLFRRPGRAKSIARVAVLGGFLPYRRLWLVKSEL